jgi:hypothetical protein
LSLYDPSDHRIAFKISRQEEYLTERGLEQQIGCRPDRWALALLKEMLDNAADAVESNKEARPPRINVRIGDDFFEVQDNGRGIPPGVVKSVLEFDTRTSSNSRYVSPSRGQMGNALKCLLCAPAVRFRDNPAAAGIVIEARGYRHEIRVEMDAITGKAVPVYPDPGPSDVKTGTLVRVNRPGAAGCLGEGRTGDF